ncbi:MAG: hypothetical protein ACM3SX_23830, partial [Deltaproteobacteria bacterium]
ESEFGRVVDEIQRQFHQLGHVGQLGRSFTWSMSRGSTGRRDVDVSVRVDAGSTRIMIDEGLGNLIGGIFGGICGGLGGGGSGPIIGTLAALHAAPVIAIALPTFYALVYGTARTIFHGAAAARERKLNAIADSLAASVAALIEERSG